MAFSALVRLVWPLLGTHVAHSLGLGMVRERYGTMAWTATHLVLSASLFRLLPRVSVVAAFWRPLVRLVSYQWPHLLASITPVWLRRGGPLGPGCAKVVNVIVGLTLLHFFLPASTDSAAPTIYLQVGTNLMDPWPWMLVVGLSVAVNGVLWLWSYAGKTRGAHTGVNHMVETSLGRALSWWEHGQYFAWALVNAVCEEVSSRGLWRYQYHLLLVQQNEDTVDPLLLAWCTNVLQGLVFGLWHYYGVPSGWTGVGLTFVYGVLMGALADYSGGLFLPILAHTIADYYIFAVVARRKVPKGKDA